MNNRTNVTVIYRELKAAGCAKDGIKHIAIASIEKIVGGHFPGGN